MKKAGKIFSLKEIAVARKNFEGKNKEKKDLRKAEYFDREILETLLRVEGCDGIRIYYGHAPENKDGDIDFSIVGNEQPRLFLVPVQIGEDGLGRDMKFKIEITDEKDGEGEPGGAGGGAPCPAFCNP
jgi:hypothetical protein